MTDDEATVRAVLRASFDARFEGSVRRALEVHHHPVVPNSHFARASSECVEIYREGYFTATALATQAVAHGIVKFVAERNGLPTSGKKTEMTVLLENKGLISHDCSAALLRILGRYRNDISHMNPPVADIHIEEIAKENLRDLALAEKAIFAFTSDNGKLIPKYPQYWDLKDESVEVFLRFG